MNQGPEEKRSWQNCQGTWEGKKQVSPASFSAGEGASIKCLGLTLPQDHQETEVREATYLAKVTEVVTDRATA